MPSALSTFKNFYFKYDFLIIGVLFAILSRIISPDLCGRILCSAIFALSFQFLYARLGLLSFGHAAFWGTGAYLTAILFRDSSLSIYPILIISTLISLLLGSLLGYLAVKSEGIYFSMITLALGQILYFVALKNPLTGGEDGIPLSNLFAEKNIPMNNYGLILIIFVCLLFLFKKFSASRWALILSSLKDNPLRAESFGFNPTKHKWAAFTLAATLAGLAGSLKTLHSGVVSLSDLHWHLSGEVVLMVLLGGAQNFIGAIVGATLLSFLQNYFAESGSVISIVQGFLFVMVIMFFRSGIISARQGKSL